MRYKTCYVCGKRFAVIAPELYQWRLTVGGKMRWFCRYNCMRVIEKPRLQAHKEAERRYLWKYAPELRAHLQAQIEAEKGGGEA